ncbi:MAG: LCP family protein [Eubacteriales bacterium]|jgi:LCP family protein required for cell wall assembly
MGNAKIKRVRRRVGDDFTRETDGQKKGRRGLGLYIAVAVLCVALLAVGSVWAMLNRGMDVEEPGETQTEVNLQVEQYAGYTRKDKYYTFLVVGTDAGGLNTDTILVVSFDTVNGKLNLLQVPRDSMLDVDRSNKRVNASFAIGGIEQLEEDIQNFLGIPIDRYAVVSILAFREIVDAVGGVEINVPQAMDYEDPYQGLTIHLEPGVQVLDGAKAEGFVRFRSDYADADIGRLKAQKAFISAFMSKLLNLGTVLKVPEMIDAINSNLKTNLSTSDMVFLAGQALELQSEDIRFFTLTGENARVDGKAYYTIYKEETMQIINEYFNPFQQELTEDKFHMVEFERQLDTQVDVNGDDLDEALNTKLSTVMGQPEAENNTVNPKNSPAIPVKTSEETGVSLEGNHLPGGQFERSSDSTSTSTSTSATAPSAGAVSPTPQASVAGAQQSGVPLKEVFESDKPQVEILNSTKSKNVVNTVRTKVEELDCQVVREDTANNITYKTTTIIVRGGAVSEAQLKEKFPGATIKSESKEEGKTDVTIIIGEDLSK